MATARGLTDAYPTSDTTTTRPGWQRRVHSTWLQVRRNWQLYLLLLLPLIYVITFKYAPMYGAQIAFKKYVVTEGIWGSDWVGLANFERFIASPKFRPVVLNTIIISFYSLIAGFPMPIILALSLNQVRLKLFKSAVQMITYAPHFISTVVLVGMMFQFLHPRVGFTAVLASFMGLDPPNWMGSVSAFRHVFVWSGVWQHLGFQSIIYLAVLATIDPTLHEAAVVDGANKLQRMWFIDIPGLMPTAVVLLVLNHRQRAGCGLREGLSHAEHTQSQRIGSDQYVCLSGGAIVARVGLFVRKPQLAC